MGPFEDFSAAGLDLLGSSVDRRHVEVIPQNGMGSAAGLFIMAPIAGPPAANN